MASVNFLYRSIKVVACLSARLLHTHDGKDYSFGGKTKLSLEKEYWKEYDRNKKSKKKKPISDVALLNLRIETDNHLAKLEIFILKEFHGSDIEVIIKDKKWLQKTINNYYDPPSTKKQFTNNLLDYADLYITKKEDEVKKNTLTRNKIAINKLKLFEKTQEEPFLISDVDTDFKIKFKKFYEKNGYSTNTIKKDLTIIKSICRHARNNHVKTSEQLDSLKIKAEPVAAPYLNLIELEQIANTNCESESLNNVRDWLIISAYCGQRVSDFLRFNKEMIIIEDGETCIEFKQKKTEKLMILPLHPKIIKILDRNNGDFPYRISDQKYNQYIKTVCKLAGISKKIPGKVINLETKRKVSGIYPKYELVTSHIGRRSFATNNYNKIPTSLIMCYTGHSTEKSFLIYIRKPPNDQVKGITKYWKKQSI
jgi:integrase